jgi:hypothetical protein
MEAEERTLLRSFITFGGLALMVSDQQVLSLLACRLKFDELGKDRCASFLNYGDQD